MTASSLYTCEEHGQGVIVIYTYQDIVSGGAAIAGSACPYCAALQRIEDLGSQVDTLEEANGALQEKLEDAGKLVKSLEKELAKLERE